MEMSASTARKLLISQKRCLFAFHLVWPLKLVAVQKRFRCNLLFSTERLFLPTCVLITVFYFNLIYFYFNLMTNTKCISIPSSHKKFIILHQKHLNETVTSTRGSKCNLHTCAAVTAILRMSDWGAADFTGMRRVWLGVRCREVIGRFIFMLRAYIYVACDMKSYVASLGNFTSDVTWPSIQLNLPNI